MPRSPRGRTPPQPDSGVLSGDPPTHRSMNDDVHARRRRQLLDNLRVLSSLGLNQSLQLPQLVCIGSQSAGKSSLIETLCRMTLPRASGTCTRCPIECRSRYVDQPWKGRVSLRFEPGSNALADGQELLFGDELSDPDELEKRIAQAQLAVLSPQLNPEGFLSVDPNRQRGGAGFTNSSVIVDISGGEQADLNFVDLPGVIANASDNSEAGHIDLVKNMIRSYICRPTAIILLVVSCQSDYETQGAGMLAEEADPLGSRTVGKSVIPEHRPALITLSHSGVLTKPDKVDINDPEDANQWIEMVEEKRNVVASGWFCVKQPDTRQRRSGLTWDNARQLEHEFFQTNEVWSRVDEKYQDRLGAENLTHQLGALLSAAIDARSAEIIAEIEALTKELSGEINKIPNLPDKHPAHQIQGLLMKFFEEVRVKIREGDPDDEYEGVIQALRQYALGFREDLYQNTAPIFVQGPETTPHEEVVPAPEPLSGDRELFIELPPRSSNSRNSGYKFLYTYERVGTMLGGAVCREPMDFGSNHPAMRILRDIVNEWESYSMNLIADAFDKVKTELSRIVADHFDLYAHGGLDRYVRELVYDLLEECKANTEQQIKFLTLQETPARSFHNALYTKRLHEYIRYYASRGAIEPACTTMARVRTLYEIAFQRYADIVPLTIDVHCVRNFGENLSIRVTEGLDLQRDRSVLEKLVKLPDPMQDRRRELQERRRQLGEVRGNLEHLRR